MSFGNPDVSERRKWVLMLLREFPGLTARAVAERCHVNTSQAYGDLYALEARRRVRRVREPGVFDKWYAHIGGGE